MNVMHREKVRSAFSAACDYDRHAHVQRLVARRLATRIAALPLPPSPRVLELGCGTGFLTQALIERGIGGEWLITDIAPAMVERCRARVGDAPGRRFEALDGEYGSPDCDEGFDLICSSLTTQWFDDQETALARMLRWLAPGGQCLFATLGAGSFAEWRQAHEREGFDPGTPAFASLRYLLAMLPDAQCGPLHVERFVETHDGALDFMRSLRAIGADTAARRHRPLDPAAMRRVMRNFQDDGGSVTYEVVTCHYGHGLLHP